MLTELQIEDLGVIASLRLVLGPGMTALTGETGAGKTMLVEAISLLVGGRADATVVRSGAKEARVEGRFVVDDEEVVLARVVPLDGRSRAYVNGRLATVGSLAEEGARLVDLHGQHAHQSLLQAATQRSALDRFGAVDLTPLQSARARAMELERSLAALGGDARARAREIDLLRFQVSELDAAKVEDATEDDVLDRQEDLLAGAQAHREAIARALSALTDDEGGAVDAIGSALAALHGRQPLLEFEERLRSVVADLGELAADLRAAGEAIDDDPERLSAIRERRHLLRELRRKYGDALAEVMEFHREAADRLAELEGYETRAAALEAERALALADAGAAAKVVAAARRAAAPALAREVQQHLSELAMPKARVEVAVEGDDPADDVRFLLGANPGEPTLPLARVASGGELARAMLALRLVLTEAPDTLVFDEVDAGIGGEAALAVGRSLAALGQRHQILVVTHLAQVAAFADVQIGVTKSEVERRTVAMAHPLDGDDRVRELSRMLSGMARSEAAQRHAHDLLAEARRPRRTRARRR
jgi:DNA repair protein RecN (Recombination protein N)